MMEGPAGVEPATSRIVVPHPVDLENQRNAEAYG